MIILAIKSCNTSRLHDLPEHPHSAIKKHQFISLSFCARCLRTDVTRHIVTTESPLETTNYQNIPCSLVSSDHSKEVFRCQTVLAGICRNQWNLYQQIDVTSIDVITLKASSFPQTINLHQATLPCNKHNWHLLETR